MDWVKTEWVVPRMGGYFIPEREGGNELPEAALDRRRVARYWRLMHLELACRTKRRKKAYPAQTAPGPQIAVAGGALGVEVELTLTALREGLQAQRAPPILEVAPLDARRRTGRSELPAVATGARQPPEQGGLAPGSRFTSQANSS